MLKKVLLVVAIALVLLAIIVVTRPDTFHIERSTTIGAPGESVFVQINDFHQWKKWSPWEKMDPAQSITFSGAAAGVGAGYAWDGKKSGKGHMEIFQSDPAKHVSLRLDFEKPMKQTNIIQFDIKPAGVGGSTLTWSMDGRNTFVGKAFSVVMNMDRMVGDDFEKGLADLKVLAEADAKQRTEAQKSATATAAPSTAE